MTLSELALHYEDAKALADEAFKKMMAYMNSVEADNLREANNIAQYTKDKAYKELKRRIG